MKIHLLGRKTHVRSQKPREVLPIEILDTLIPERVHRNNPRVVKKPVSKFRSKKPRHRGTRQRVEAPKFHIPNQHFSLN